MTFGLGRGRVLQSYRFLGEALWKYLASALYILLAFYVSKLIDVITGVWLKRFASQTETTLDDLLLELLRGPVKVVAFVLLVNVGPTLLDWSEKARLYLSRALTVIVAASLTYLAVRILNLLLGVWRRRLAQDDRKLNEQLYSLVRKSLVGFVVVVAVLVTAQNPGINMTAAIASLSIGGLAVGLAAQDTLANLFGAVAVLTDRPFRVGDTIKLDTTEGTVESIGLRSTRIRNPDGHLVAVPNKAVGNAAITNITGRPNIRTSMNLVLTRTLRADKVRRALALLDEVYRGNPMSYDVWISFNQFGGEHQYPGRPLVEGHRLQALSGWHAGDEPRGQRPV